MRTKSTYKPAFTLIELLVVISIVLMFVFGGVAAYRSIKNGNPTPEVYGK
jgi:prepilin-type N-terminal cleavage/methylation domain-containing protein